MKHVKPNTWLTSDLHFFHKNILRFYPNRKCDNLLEMHLKIIKRFNNTVKPEDTVIFVGDIFLGGSKEDQKRTLSKLICKRKILVSGNHDKSLSQMEKLGFDFACNEMVKYIQGERVRINHFPYMEGLDRFGRKFADRAPHDDGGFLIHGHSHSTTKVKDRMIHVGLDAWGMAPVSENKIASIINKIKKAEEIASEIKKTQ